MTPTDKIKPTDKFYTIDKTPFDFQSIGGRQRFNANSTYQALMNRGAYVLIVEDYDKTTHKQDGSMVFDEDHFNAGVIALTPEELQANKDARNIKIGRKREVRHLAESDKLEQDLNEAARAGEVVDWQPWLDMKAQIRIDLPYEV